MAEPEPAGLRVIIGYKLVKAAAELSAGATFFAFGSVGLAAKLSLVAQAIRLHATEAWSIALAEKLLDVSTAHNVFVVAMAIVTDGLVSLLEGWALYRGFAWARWLVLLSTAALVPFEVAHIVRHPTVGRAILLLANITIVIYLASRHRHADERGVAV